MNLEQVRALLTSKILVEADGNESEWARMNGISQGYVTHVRRGSMPPGKKILAALGLQKDIDYQPIHKLKG